MPLQPTIDNLAVPDAGATHTLDSTVVIERYIVDLTGTGTMSGNTSITSDLADITDSVYVVELPGGFILGAQTFTVFGTALTAAQALNPCMIIARWGGAAFQTQVYTDWSANNTVLLAHMNNDSVGTSEVVDEAISLAKMADLARGSMIVGATASNRPTALDIKTADRLLMGDGTDAVYLTPSGDISVLSAAGAFTIANDAITTVKLLDANVTFAKIEGVARGNILRGSSAGVMEELNLGAVGAGGIIFTDATDVLVGLMSGDGSLDLAGALTISAGLNTFITKVTIATADVLTGNATPITIVGAPGAAKIVRPLACFNTLTYNSVAYATNGRMQLRHDTAAEPCFISGTNTLFGTVTQTLMLIENGSTGNTDTQFLANKALLWEINTGDPTAGNSQIEVYVIYQIVDV